MIAKSVVVLCLLLAAQTYAEFETDGPKRGLTGSGASASSGSSANSKKGKRARASASVSVSASGGGRVTGKAFASSEAVTEIIAVYSEAIADAVSRVASGGNAKAEAIATANSISSAIAEAYADAAVEITSTSPGGKGCGAAFGEAKAVARVYAEGWVEALAEASNYINFADAKAAANAIIGATASAFATAQASACGKGVFSASAVQTSLARALASPYVNLFAGAYAAVSDKDATALVVALADSGVLEVTTAQSTTTTQTSGPATAFAEGSAAATTNKICDNSKLGRCCRNPSSRFCRCAGFGCVARLESRRHQKPAKYSYRDDNGKTTECVCAK